MVVDILRFTTAVEVAVTHGARAIPEPAWRPAAGHDVGQTVPRLSGGVFAQLS